MTTLAPIIIIGSGLAGYTLARELRKVAAEIPITIITAEDGRYYSKPQLSSALTHNKTAAALGMMTAERMAMQLKATIINDTWVTGIDTSHQQVIAGDQVLSYSKLILACGAAPIRIPFAGNAADKVLSVNNLQDYERFRELLSVKKHVAIIGAGLVGCEFANDLHNGGHEVSIIALSETPLNLLLPAQAGRAVQQGLQQAGVNWHLGCAVRILEYTGSDFRLSLSNDQNLKVDVVLSAIGLKPNTELAQAAGLTVEKGIVVNRYLETSVPNVFALGDCAEIEGQVMLYVNPLVIGAKALAQTLAGQPTPVAYPPMPIIIKTPACPVVVQPPFATADGAWQVVGNELNIKALYRDAHQQLQGFALTGTAVAEKMQLVEQLPTSLF